VKYIIRRRFNSSIKKRIRKGTSNNNEKPTIRLFNSFRILLNVEPILIKLFIIAFILKFKKLFVISLT
jgi:hypothetical protein